jgi:MraZ protein
MHVADSGKRRSAVFLAGTYEIVIDAKNRLMVPYLVRRELGPKEEQSFYAVPGRRLGTLALYPKTYYDGIREKRPPLDSLSDESYEYFQFENAQTAFLETDDQGRVLLPQRLLQRAGLNKEVVLTGAGDHLELWRREDFEAFEAGLWQTYPQRRAKAIDEIKRIAVTSEAASTEPASNRAQTSPAR